MAPAHCFTSALPVSLSVFSVLGRPPPAPPLCWPNTKEWPTPGAEPASWAQVHHLLRGVFDRHRASWGLWVTIQRLEHLKDHLLKGCLKPKDFKPNSFLKVLEGGGWWCLGDSVVESLLLAQVVIPWSWDRVPHWASLMEPASPSACVSASACVFVCLMNE